MFGFFASPTSMSSSIEGGIGTGLSLPASVGGVGPTVPDYNEDFVMGVPKGTPKWLVPAIIGAVAVLVGVVGAVVFLR